MSGKGGGGTFSQLRDHLLPPSATAALPDFFFAGGVDAEACGYLRGDAVVGAAYSGQWYDTVSHPTKTPQKSLPQQQQQQRGMHDSGLEVLMVVVAVVNLLSTTFVFQTLSAASLPPYFLLAFRTLFAGLLGYVVCGVLGFWQRQFWHAAALSMCSDHLWKIIMLGLLSSAGALGMWFTANQYIRSTTTSSFMLLVPFFTAVVSQAMGRGVVRNRDVVGFFLGGTVILCLFLPDWTRGDSSLHSSSSGEVIAGILLSLMGGLLFAMATAFLARNCSLHPFAVSCGQNLWGGLLLVPLSFITEWNDPPEHIAQHFGFLRGLSPHIWVFFAFLTILALVLVWLYNSLVYSSGPTAAASTLYFVPLESGILGIALHDEWQEFGIGIQSVVLVVLVAVAICGYFLGGWSERVPSLQECGLLRWCGKEDSLFLWCHERVCAAHLQDTARGPMNEFGLRVAIPEGERSSSKAWTMQQGILDRQRLDEETTRLLSAGNSLLSEAYGDESDLGSDDGSLYSPDSLDSPRRPGSMALFSQRSSHPYL